MCSASMAVSVGNGIAHSKFYVDVVSQGCNFRYDQCKLGNPLNTLILNVYLMNL